ncbi:hypothetical protein SAY86_032146 [Trapa natans]|uniref:Uncharacterized protein n=1 Tax=Trapa natans TaxID=22666 RepID=A0AAN7RAE1_TRANT|nr:hypothetical protein SAY86_032146 [Trapa natans]
MGRAPCCDKANVKKGPWSPDEDTKLKDYIEKYGIGGNWIALPQKIGLKRCGKSCRLRWLNYLRPNIKHGGFSEEEDKIICSLYISIGSRWSIIAAQLPGRTDNDIKNYWNTRLKKKLLGRRKQSNARSMGYIADNRDANSSEDSDRLSALSNSAIERLQLHLQLQRMNSHSSFYSNTALWPSMHSLHENMVNTFQLSDENLWNCRPDHQVQIDTANIDPHSGNASSSYEPVMTADSITSLLHEPTKISDSADNSPGPQEIMSLGVEQILCGDYNDSQTAGHKYFMPQENQYHQMMPDFHCFRRMLEETNSWDDSPSLDIVEGGGVMFQDSETGYRNL